jgi:hypothetical protein
LVEKIVVTADNIDLRMRDNGIERLALDITDSAKIEVPA